jgi:steroid 5-alpha reductase family enzyme
MNLWYVISQIKKRNDVADIAWGLGFVLLSMTGVMMNPNTKNILIFALVAIWGLRLAYHIGTRVFKSTSEDKRYQKMREEWKGSAAINSWYRIFMNQGFFLLLVASSILAANNSPTSEINMVNILWILLWIFGFTFEVIWDKQLKEFLSKAENKGHIMKSGLWKFTRHPNYFGEATLWWGLWLITYWAELFWFGLIWPITITILLRFISGVPLAENRYKDNQEFIDYAKKTPAMIPHFFIKK